MNISILKKSRQIVASSYDSATCFTIAATVMTLSVSATLPAQAALITSSASFTSATVVDFSQFSGDFNFTTGPVQIGGLVGKNIEWTSTTSNSVIGNNTYGLNPNGSWNSQLSGYTGLNADSESMTYTFNDGPVSGVGGFVNYSTNFSPVLIEALDIGGNVLESYNLVTNAPIFTPGETNGGAFRGIQRSSNDIYAFRLSNGYIALDNLTFESQAASVPEPASILGLAVVGGLSLTSWLKRS